MMIITTIIIKLDHKRVTELAQTNLLRGTQIQNNSYNTNVSVDR